MPFAMGGNVGFQYYGPRVVFVGVGGVTAFGLQWTSGQVDVVVVGYLQLLIGEAVMRV